MTYFTDEQGKRRIVSELCGRMVKDDKTGMLIPDDKSNEFIEASWVSKPAFRGAIINHYIGDVDSRVNSILAMNSDKLQAVVDDIFKLRVADKEGMMALRVAWNELNRRKYEAMVDRLSSGRI
jgi:hypothetical protein